MGRGLIIRKQITIQTKIRVVKIIYIHTCIDLSLGRVLSEHEQSKIFVANIELSEKTEPSH